MGKTIDIGGRLVGEDNPCFIIAEAGVNHNGRLDLALKLIDSAADAGADAVKFQTFRTEDVIIAGIEKAPYQKCTTAAEESQAAMLKKLELPEQFYPELVAHAAKRNILFLSTCCEENSVDLLDRLGVPAFKLGSCDTTNMLLLEKVAKRGKPVILSTGMCSLSEIERAYSCVRANGSGQIAILKCTSNYPTDIREVNLRAMATLQACFDAVIGFSDHTEGVGATPYAVALGAKIVEKHFTLDKTMEGPDHQASLDPAELKAWVREIRRVEAMLGGRELVPAPCERATKVSLQKNLVTRRAVKRGESVSRDNVASKRTGGRGISALELDRVVGQKFLSDHPADQVVTWAHLGG